MAASVTATSVLPVPPKPEPTVITPDLSDGSRMAAIFSCRHSAMAPRRARSFLPGGITSPCLSARLERAPLSPSCAGAGASKEGGAAGTQVALPSSWNSVHQAPVSSGYRDIASPYSGCSPKTEEPTVPRAVLAKLARNVLPDHRSLTMAAYGWGQDSVVRPPSLVALERAVADPKGFLTTPRQDCAKRPVQDRVRDWNEVYDRRSLLPIIRTQAGRCMDCGIPFCHHGCPLGNLIPEWNDLVWRGDWAGASERLHATNNFPEFTGRLCPAPCEPACVVAISQPAVTIKNVEATIADQAWERGHITPRPAGQASGRTVAVIGSGPAGLACAQQLTRAGHAVTVYERDDRFGGLLRYGIPEFRLEKRHLDRRLAQMRAEGTRFRAGVAVGTDLSAAGLRRRHDVVVVAVGAMARRELPVPGRDLAGIHQAMDYLPLANRAC